MNVELLSLNSKISKTLDFGNLKSDFIAFLYWYCLLILVCPDRWMLKYLSILGIPSSGPYILNYIYLYSNVVFWLWEVRDSDSYFAVCVLILSLLFITQYLSLFSRYISQYLNLLPNKITFRDLTKRIQTDKQNTNCVVIIIDSYHILLNPLPLR